MNILGKKIAAAAICVLAAAALPAFAFAKNARFDGSQYSISLEFL